ncbi:PadR family transcriptional regulator [Halobacillus kuroshimensis]|uniref:PadR family transcriptional regulator n=1 Tax=Halobacillus kuroshimensis TaxID=302481 RepID=A0ABS3DS25_9BACI|nr:PadR family transcriptional regulator [Halobacillus kuroshimensis]MBN8234139.1 PadR family transcriptional regulator [Halobacillus kuroshimensis]
MKENHTPYALLGLMTAGFHTGYEMKQMMDGSLNHFWKISYGQIYPTLKKLVEEGCADVKVTSQEGRPDKKEYIITPSGEEQLRSWLMKPVEDLPVEKNELLLKLFFSRNQEKSVILHQLESYREKLYKKQHTYQSIKEMLLREECPSEDAPFWIITLNYGLATTEAAVEWCEKTKSRIDEMKEE